MLRLFNGERAKRGREEKEREAKGELKRWRNRRRREATPQLAAVRSLPREKPEAERVNVLLHNRDSDLQICNFF